MWFCFENKIKISPNDSILGALAEGILWGWVLAAGESYQHCDCWVKPHLGAWPPFLNVTEVRTGTRVLPGPRLAVCDPTFIFLLF